MEKKAQTKIEIETKPFSKEEKELISVGAIDVVVVNVVVVVVVVVNVVVVSSL